MQTLQTWLKILETRTKGTKSPQINVLNILSLKQFANLQVERNSNAKEKNAEPNNANQTHFKC